MLRAYVSGPVADRLVESGGQLPEQRRLVTALFADLSGFTALASRLDPEDLVDVVDPLLEGLVRIAHRAEGHVGAFAGDALLVFFGAPVAHEDDAARGVRVAAEMLREFPALLVAAGPQAAGLSLRIGVDTGWVMARLIAGDVRTEYSVLGDAVNTAQRLQSVAPPGGCWVGATTARLAGDAVALDRVGPVQVKGKDEPLEAYALRDATGPEISRWRDGGTVLVGRVEERAALLAEDRGLVLLRGEAGRGKSRLLGELRTDRPLVEGGAVAADLTTSYRAWQGVVRGLGCAPAVLEPAGAPSAGERRAAVAAAVVDVLVAAGRTTVVLEDLHWADDASLELLEDVLAAALPDVLVVATARPSPAADRLAPSATVLDLAPLPDADVAALLGALLGGEPPDDLAAEVARRSSGSPLCTVELARALSERGLVRRGDGAALVTAADPALLGQLVPETLEGLLGARVDALPSSAATVLLLAAVLGEPLDRAALEALGTAAGVGADTVRADVGLLLGQGLLRPVGPGLGFGHALVAETTYARASRRRRRALHLLAADVAPGAGPGWAARHLYLGGGGARAVAALQRAADESVSRGALAEAGVHLVREVELLRGDPASRTALPDRLVVLGEVLETLGRYDDAEPVLREALDLGAGWRATRALAGVLRRTGRYADAVAVADEVLGGDLEADAEGLLREERGWALAATGDLAAALATAEPPPSGAPEDVAARLGLLSAYCAVRGGDPAHGESLARASAEVLSGGIRARALRLLGDALEEQERYGEAVVVLTQGREVAERAGAFEEALHCLTTLAIVRMHQDRPDDALALERAAITAADRARHRHGQATARGNHAWSLLQAGQAEAARALVDETLLFAARYGLSGVAAGLHETLAHCRFAAGDLPGAVASATDAATGFAAAGMVSEAAEAAVQWRQAADGVSGGGRDVALRIAEVLGTAERPAREVADGALAERSG